MISLFVIDKYGCYIISYMHYTDESKAHGYGSSDLTKILKELPNLKLKDIKLMIKKYKTSEIYKNKLIRFHDNDDAEEVNAFVDELNILNNLIR